MDFKKYEDKLTDIFKKIDDLEYLNSKKVLDAFHKENIMETDFYGTTGYGYNDIGRDKIERVFSDIFKCEDAIVRKNIISGTHAITTALFGVLRPNNLILSITGVPYDTIRPVFGIKENPSSLKSFGIIYDQIDLINSDFDYEKIENYLKNNKVNVIYIQRSRGYSRRNCIDIQKLEKVISLIKSIDKNIIVMIDNCYTEFVEDKFPTEVGADLIIESLIKNLGGAITSGGGYIAGKKKLVNLCAERLMVPGCAKEIGPSLNFNKEILMGLYNAPSAVASALKTAILTSTIMEDFGYNVSPKYDEKRSDIVQTIEFSNEKDLINFCCGIQNGSAIDANATLQPTDMPGYDDKIIMASGSFTSGSSIEISCDAPLRKPYIAFMQGAFSYSYGKLALEKAIDKLINGK